jgi:HEAT repeat protein
MTSPADVAANFASVLTLLRDKPEAREEQAAAFRLLLASLADQPLHLVVTPRGVRLSGSELPEKSAGVRAVREQLLSHGVGEIQLPAAIKPALLLDLLSALAARRGRFRSVHELATEVNGAEAGLLIAPPAPEDVSAAGDWSVYEELADDVTEPSVELSEFRSIDGERDGQLDALLRSLDRDPSDRGVPELLNEIVAVVDGAVGREQWAEAARATSAVVAAEARAGDAAFGRAYSIALRRMLPRSVLEHLARMVNGPRRARVLPVLKRMGADATEVLLGLLASASTIGERRAYYGALRQMTAGTDLLVNMLTHDEWFVVRNVADLCGELRIEAAVPRLARHLAHEDERVRRSVAGALGKIGTPATTEPLRQAMRDPSPTVRLQAVQAIDGRRGRGLAMTLAVLLDEETHSDITREMLLALGRIGTTEAVQALGRAAAPGRRLFNRKPVALRLAAIEGLRVAGNAAAGGLLQPMLSDDDGEVRDAARKALAQLNA